MRVDAIDRAERTVTLGDGTTLPYARLVLATGGRARVVPIDGLSPAQTFTLRTLEDSLAIGAALATAKSALIVGGGWIGLEIAAAARRLGAEVTLVELAERLCQRAAPAIVSEWLLRLHTSRGVDVRLGDSVVQASDGRAELASGAIVPADMVVIGVGLVANDELARAAGLACADGILTDPCGRTDDPAVFGCGDVAVFQLPGAPQPMRLESWANAQHQAIACAHAVLGQDAAYEEIPWFWSDQYDKTVEILGFPPAGEPVVRGDLATDSFMLFWLDGARLVAVAAVDGGKDYKIARLLMERQVPVEAAALADETVRLRGLLSR